MFRFHGRVFYTDGTEEAFEAGNVALAAWERYAVRQKLPLGTDSPPTLSSLVIAHHALGIREGVDAWIATVEGVELHSTDSEDADGDHEAGAVPPTPQIASIG